MAQYKFNCNGQRRKELVSAMVEILNKPIRYMGMPTANYEVGGYIIDKFGTVTGEESLNLLVGLGERGFEPEKSQSFHLITPRGILLIQERFDTEEAAQKAGYGIYFHHDGRGIFTRPVEGKENCVTFAMVGEPFPKAEPTPELPEK